jgi:signal peptidase I
MHEPAALTPAETRPKLQRPRLFGELIDTAILVGLVYTLVNLATVRFFIEGMSMEPSFHEGQNVIVSRVDYLFGTPQRGDIVVIDRPDDDDTPQNPLLIKRLIGLPGETLRITDGVVYINDVALDEPYILEPCTRSTCQDETWDIPIDSYFFMGDNRNNSRDSREFGAIPPSRIIGEVVVRYWEPQDIGIVVRHRYPAAP